MGEDAATRTTTLHYYASGPAQGYIEHITDALGRNVHFTYDLAGRVITQTLPDGRTVSYSDDGFLLTGTTWNGPVAGSVTRQYNPDFQVTAMAVNGQSVAFSYDLDGLLTQAGSLSLTRDVAHGLLTGTTIGMVTTTQSYNPFGSSPSPPPTARRSMPSPTRATSSGG